MHVLAEGNNGVIKPLSRVGTGNNMLSHNKKPSFLF